jgi:hypothetical protein
MIAMACIAIALAAGIRWRSWWVYCHERAALWEHGESESKKLIRLARDVARETKRHGFSDAAVTAAEKEAALVQAEVERRIPVYAKERRDYELAAWFPWLPVPPDTPPPK